MQNNQIINRASKHVRIRYTPETFKICFKVGDVIEAFSTCLRLTITAIGEKRFLAIDHRGRERVCTMENQLGWTKIGGFYDRE